jgi:hypothetical protein
VSGPIWFTAIYGYGALQTGAIILAIFERSLGIGLGFASAGQAASEGNTGQAIFRGLTTYASGWLALFGLRSIAVRPFNPAALSLDAVATRNAYVSSLREEGLAPANSGAAYDIETGRIVTASSFGEAEPNPHPVLVGKAEPFGGVNAQVQVDGKTLTIGRCWEFRAANELLWEGSKIANIRFTRSVRARDLTEQPHCSVCQQMFGLQN